jgi:ABC-type multidrug transport system ATPase subunit
MLGTPSALPNLQEPSVIELRHVSKQFKKSVVLDDLNLSIASGERIALIGSNGAGKTTLIRWGNTCMRVNFPSSA